MMNLRSRIRRNLLAASPAAAAQYIPPQLAGQPPALGEAAGCTSSVWPFVAGAVVWAFFGEQIKAALHLGGAAAQKGISAAHAQLGTAEAANRSPGSASSAQKGGSAREDPAGSHPEAELALGRILRMASRPAQPGDVEEYERCRAIIMDAVDSGAPPEWTPNFIRDRYRGAAGD